MRDLLIGVAFASLGLGACAPLAGAADASTDAPATCGTQTCTTTQLCLYRECSEKDRCRPQTSCPTGTTPADCNGKPGCIVPASQCPAVVQGCRDIPVSCGGDVTCACASICGSAQQCSKVDGRNAACTGS